MKTSKNSRDKRRLDWLQRRLGKWQGFDVIVRPDGTLQSIHLNCAGYRTHRRSIRAAIDAAMKEKPDRR